MTTAETCDRCGGEASKAAVRVELPSGGVLTFCEHHAREQHEKLAAAGARFVDLAKVAATSA